MLQQRNTGRLSMQRISIQLSAVVQSVQCSGRRDICNPALSLSPMLIHTTAPQIEGAKRGIRLNVVHGDGCILLYKCTSVQDYILAEQLQVQVWLMCKCKKESSVGNLIQITGFKSQLQFLACVSNKSIGKKQQCRRTWFAVWSNGLQPSNIATNRQGRQFSVNIFIYL